MHSRGKQSLAIQQLDWNISTHTLFEHFCHKPWAMLLDSANAAHTDAKYDIIAISPIACLTYQNNLSKLTIVDEALSPLLASFDSQQAVFENLAQLQQTLYPTKQPCKFPFSGGALGSFSYDLGRVIEKLPDSAIQDIHLPEMSVGFYDFCLIYCYQQQCWFGLHYQGQIALDTALNKIEVATKKITKNKSTQPKFKLTSPWKNQTTSQQYQEKFNRVQQYLHSGDCYQINLTQRFSANYHGNEWQAYCALSAANKAPFSAFLRLENHCIMSISPERFIQLSGDKISTKPIKGTLPRSADAEIDKQKAQQLQHSVKDRAENVMIVDLLRNDISKVATAGTVNVPKLFDIESFPAVHHLVSTIEATLAANLSAIDIIQAAFPGGSITGAPKIRAMQIIEELEPSRRSIYCGSIGYISQDGTMDTSITIRTLLTEEDKIYCWAGGGVVADSNADAEYQECFDKVSKILPILEKL
ncbi:aminodeoxychorismate synthase, component I [Shewanella sp. 10N.286.52.C2]|uniref:aminodeoxychorismate synthase component I n=1 Tax=Shewanella sp. 10N.286.52.C2 TaxID=1880838 RepID=UPI000C834A5D|nr:aminodeoxychorismate synthase component I [Shewanella sp. 10N.286.52.C2]PMG28551.1 aminodeoxychorismate synthase, component I [Shewanella sp. 10N.286.52.C2]